MGYKFSKAFGPTSSVAGTKTGIGSTYVIRPGGPYTIKKLYLAKGNVVNAKERAGIVHIELTGVDGTYEYATSNGVGGATNSHAIGREEIDCLIPAPSGSTMTVSITDAENATACLVGADFYDDGGRVDSYSAGGAGVDPAAATLKEIGTISVVRAGAIVQIRYACGNIVDAKSASGKLEILVPGQAGPFEYVVGDGVGGATLGGPGHADVFNVNIPVTLNATITCNVTYTDATDSATISLAVA